MRCNVLRMLSVCLPRTITLVSGTIGPVRDILEIERHALSGHGADDGRVGAAIHKHAADNVPLHFRQRSDFSLGSVWVTGRGCFRWGFRGGGGRFGGVL